jgi:hypothetical protein
MEIQKKIYFKGPKAHERLRELQKITEEKFRGNFSAMTHYCYYMVWGSAPETKKRKRG